MTSPPEVMRMDDYEVYWNVYQALSPEVDVLDVGCGNGDLVSYLAQRLGREIVGVDSSDARFERARREAQRSGLSHLVRYIRSDARTMPFTDQSFDAALLVFTLHHLILPEAVLREVRRVLKPEGRLLIAELVVEEGQPRYGCRTLLVTDVYGMLERAGFEAPSTHLLSKDVALLLARADTSAELSPRPKETGAYR